MGEDERSRLRDERLPKKPILGGGREPLRVPANHTTPFLELSRHREKSHYD